EDCLALSLKSSGSSSQSSFNATEQSREPAAPRRFEKVRTDVVGGSSPDAAFLLGLIPGVGAIYNGEYFKAAIHVLIFGMLTSLGAALLAVAFYFYMPFEAYYTAKKRKLSARGIPVVTPIDRFYEQFQEHTGG